MLCKAVVSILLLFLIMSLGVWCHIYILLLICTALHNCLSLGSLVFAADAE